MDPHPLSEEVSQQLAHVCGVLAHPQRLRMLDALVRRPRPAEALARDLTMPLAEIRDHLQALQTCGLVLARASVTGETYALADRCTVEALSLLHALERNAVPHQSDAIRP